MIEKKYIKIIKILSRKYTLIFKMANHLKRSYKQDKMYNISNNKTYSLINNSKKK